jgi:hypothetical protein
MRYATEFVQEPDPDDPVFEHDIPLCDQCGEWAELEDVDSHGVRFHVIEADGTCVTQTCVCRFCRTGAQVVRFQ